MMQTESPPPLAESRRLVKCAWRIASQHRGVTKLEELLRVSRRIRATFYLTAEQHRACCQAALEKGETWLAWRLTELERAAGTPNPA